MSPKKPKLMPPIDPAIVPGEIQVTGFYPVEPKAYDPKLVAITALAKALDNAEQIPPSDARSHAIGKIERAMKILQAM